MQKAKPTDDAFRAIPDHDKIKLRAAGYGLVYRVTVVVVAVGPQSAPFGLGQGQKSGETERVYPPPQHC